MQLGYLVEIGLELSWDRIKIRMHKCACSLPVREHRFHQRMSMLLQLLRQICSVDGIVPLLLLRHLYQYKYLSLIST